MIKKFSNIIHELKTLNILESELLNIEKNKEKQYIRLHTILKTLSNKNKEIESLSSITFHSVYRLIIGDLDESLEILKQHYLKLAIEYHNLTLSLDQLEIRIKAITEKIKEYENVKSDLKTTLLDYKTIISSHNLNKLKNTYIDLEYQLELKQELEEAIKQGSYLVRKISYTIRFLNKISIFNYDPYISNPNTTQIVKYQNQMINIKHELIKYEGEVNDVYRIMLNHESYENNIVSDFMTQYSKQMVADIITAKDNNYSIQFLTNYKSTIKNLNKAMRKDLKMTLNNIKALEDIESKQMKLLIRK